MFYICGKFSVVAFNRLPATYVFMKTKCNFYYVCHSEISTIIICVNNPSFCFIKVQKHVKEKKQNKNNIFNTEITAHISEDKCWFRCKSKSNYHKNDLGKCFDGKM